MFIITGKIGNSCYILDTSDSIKELISLDDIQKTVNLGIKIYGLIQVNGVYYPFCKEENALKEFISKIKPTLARLKLSNKVTRDNIFDSIFNLAVKYGFVRYKTDLVIDIENNSLYIKPLNHLYIYKNDGEFSEISKLNVCDKKVSSLSRLGTDALKYITLSINGEEHTLKSLFNELMAVDSYFKLDKIMYIGITPSNKMFKVITTWNTYTLQFGTVAQLNKIKNKILDSKIKMDEAFKYYVEDVSYSKNDDCVCILKFNIKKGLSSKEELHTKYSTLMDVFVRT